MDPLTLGALCSIPPDTLMDLAAAGKHRTKHTLEDLVRCAARAARASALEHTRSLLRAELSPIAEVHGILFGPLDDTRDWRASLAESVETFLAKYAEHLPASWLSTWMSTAQGWSLDEVIDAAAVQMIASVTAGVCDARQLADLGISPADTAAAYAALPDGPRPRMPRISAHISPLEGAIPVSVFRALRDYSSLTDTEAAALLGVTRTTYRAYVEGRAFCVPSEEAMGRLRGALQAHIMTLGDAAECLDAAVAATAA